MKKALKEILGNKTKQDRMLEKIRIFIKYISVGILNTIVGYGTIFFLMYIHFSPEISNIIGYVFGISVSYILNKNFTFRSENSHSRALPKFLISLGISYVFNLLTLMFCIHVLTINPYVAQIISGAVYTLSGFIFFKYYAFRG